MKLVGLVLASIASTAVAVASTHVAVSSVSGQPILASSNASHASSPGPWENCRTHIPGPSQWWYNTWSNGPYWCYGPDNSSSFRMLYSYRSGGTINVHWKYTDDANDPECLANWKYHGEDGTTLFAQISGKTTRERDTRSWCALPVYRSGGVEGYQWGYCSC